MTNWAWMLRCESMTAFCGPVVPLEKNIITGSSPVTARSVVAGSDGRRSESVCSSFHDIVLTPPVEIDVNSSFTITVYKRRQFNKQFNPFKGTLKPHSNGPLYSITVVGTLAVDGWAVIQRGGAWAGCPPQSPPRCTKCNSPPINSQCTDFIIFHVAL